METYIVRTQTKSPNAKEIVEWKFISNELGEPVLEKVKELMNAGTVRNLEYQKTESYNGFQLYQAKYEIKDVYYEIEINTLSELEKAISDLNYECAYFYNGKIELTDFDY